MFLAILNRAVKGDFAEGDLHDNWLDALDESILEQNVD